jgi:hypothetical protein
MPLTKICKNHKTPKTAENDKSQKLQPGKRSNSNTASPVRTLQGCNIHRATRIRLTRQNTKQAKKEGFCID